MQDFEIKLTTSQLPRLPNVTSTKLMVSRALRLETSDILAILGPCAMSSDYDTIDKEGDSIRELGQLRDIQALHRLPPWKPRSNPEDWHGHETTNPDEALRILESRARRTGNVAIEIGKTEHLERYGRFLSFAWFGSRNVGKEALKGIVSKIAPNLPLGVKHGLDGDFNVTLAQIEALRLFRPEGAPIVPIYRGGNNAQTPETWENEYRRMLELTSGQMIVDVAHGGEMAHDPHGEFKKSIAGQIFCLRHVIDIAASNGEMPASVMIEASDTPSPTDPNMPFYEAINGVKALRATVDITQSHIKL